MGMDSQHEQIHKRSKASYLSMPRVSPCLAPTEHACYQVKSQVDKVIDEMREVSSHPELLARCQMPGSSHRLWR